MHATCVCSIVTYMKFATNLPADLQLLTHRIQSSTGTEASIDTAQRQSDSSMQVTSSAAALLPCTYTVDRCMTKRLVQGRQ